MSLPDQTPHPRHSPAAAAAYTVLPFALLLALIAWIYPVLKYHHDLHPTTPAATATAPATATPTATPNP
ncbi:hypothetical protein [Kitasatospora sp. NPDC057541]|uniref:hypothetical protein n=1 Tax=unclassified Kitasatospora TaxID=2633591 RepID=UPI0036B80E5B